MSDAKFYAKTKSVELRSELERAYKKSKPSGRVLVVMKKVVSNMILNNNEVVNLFPEIIEAMRLDNYEIRKLCLQFIRQFAKFNVQDALSALPFLLRFRDDNNPKLRALAIKTLSSVPIKQYLEHSVESIRKLANDKIPSVRANVAYSVSRIYQNDPEIVIGERLIELLNELLYDKDEMVVSNTLASLSYITENGKSLSLNIDHNHAVSLLSYLEKTNEWSQIYILNSLISHVPQTSDEALEMIEGIFPYLQHENTAVILNAVKAIVYFCYYVKNPELVIPTLPKRLGSSLVSLMSKPYETQFLVLRNIILLLVGRKELVMFDVEMFFCRYDDPIYIKDTKLEIIYLVANENNAHLVLEELEKYATEVDVPMARKAIRAFGNLALKLNFIADKCVEIILDLLSNEIPYIIQEAAIVFRNLLRKYPDKYKSTVNNVLKSYKLVYEPESKSAMIWIVGQYCQEIKNIEEIFECLTSNFKEDTIEVQCISLTAVTKIYLLYPNIGENMLLRIFKIATEELNNPDVRDRAFFYWRLISAQNANGPGGEFQMNTKNVILHENPKISVNNDDIDPHILLELELTIGSLASIYLKPLNSVFRLAKKKELTYSPALQNQNLGESNNNTGYSFGSNSTDGKYSPSKETIIQGRMNSVRNYGTSAKSINSQGSNLTENIDISNSPRKSSMVERISRRASIISRKK